MDYLLKIIIFLYAATGIIASIGYLPTIKDLYNKKPSANINSYIIWTFCAVIGFFYAVLLIKDLLLEIVTGLNFLFCAIILILAIRIRVK